jgi:hypothetical protein
MILEIERDISAVLFNHLQGLDSFCGDLRATAVTSEHYNVVCRHCRGWMMRFLSVGERVEIEVGDLRHRKDAVMSAVSGIGVGRSTKVTTGFRGLDQYMT